MPATKPTPATDSATDLRRLVGDDATADFESDPKFIDSNPTADASSENLAVQRDTDDTVESDDEMTDEDDDEEEDEDDLDEEDEEDFDDDEDDEDVEDEEDEDLEEDDEDEVGFAAGMLHCE